jgi:hypothetical protein
LGNTWVTASDQWTVATDDGNRLLHWDAGIRLADEPFDQ